MSGKNKILVGVLALLLVLSVGYALFSETIVINGTATAQGNFALTTSCQKGFSADALTYYADRGVTSTDSLQAGYSNDSCDVTGQRVDINVDLNLPGATRVFSVKVENTGTIDAAIPVSISGATKFNQTVTVYNSNDDTLYATYKSTENNFYSNVIGYGHFLGFGDSSEILAKKSDGTIYALSDVDEAGMTMKDTSTGVSYLRIKPGESVTFVIIASWDERVTDDSKYSVATFSNQFPFSQVTTNMVETSDVTIRY